MILTIFKIAESRGLNIKYSHPRASSASGEGGGRAIRQVPQKNGKGKTGAKVARLCPGSPSEIRKLKPSFFSQLLFHFVSQELKTI